MSLIKITAPGGDTGNEGYVVQDLRANVGVHVPSGRILFSLKSKSNHATVIKIKAPSAGKAKKILKTSGAEVSIGYV